jgi:hypothetical protein
MIPRDVETLIANGEDTRHRFKRDFAHASALAAELIAFINGLGLGDPLPMGVVGDGSAHGLDKEALANSAR